MKSILHNKTIPLAIALVAFIFSFADGYSQSCKPDSSIFFTYVSGTQIRDKSTKSVYAYNAKGETSKQYLYTWNDSMNDWEKWRVWDNTYTPAGKLAKMVDSFWINNGWKAYYITTYQYNANGSVSQKLEQRWDDNTSTFINNYKEDVAFNASNDTSQILRQEWDNNTWKNKYKIDYNYSLDTLKSRELKVWNASNAWEKTWFEELIYNNRNLVGNMNFFRANAGKTAYDKNQRTSYTYNSLGALIATYTEDYDAFNLAWVSKNSASYTFTTDNCMKINSYATSGVGATSETEYYYSAGVNGVEEVSANSLHGYPVPASNTFTIKADQDIDPSTVMIANAIGQLMPVEFTAKQQNSISVNVQNYPAGVYFVQLGNAKLRFVKQ